MDGLNSALAVEPPFRDGMQNESILLRTSKVLSDGKQTLGKTKQERLHRIAFIC